MYAAGTFSAQLSYLILLIFRLLHGSQPFITYALSKAESENEENS